INKKDTAEGSERQSSDNFCKEVSKGLSSTMKNTKISVPCPPPTPVLFTAPPPEQVSDLLTSLQEPVANGPGLATDSGTGTEGAGEEEEEAGATAPTAATSGATGGGGRQKDVEGSEAAEGAEELRGDLMQLLRVGNQKIYTSGGQREGDLRSVDTAMLYLSGIAKSSSLPHSHPHTHAPYSPSQTHPRPPHQQRRSQQELHLRRLPAGGPLSLACGLMWGAREWSLKNHKETGGTLIPTSRGDLQYFKGQGRKLASTVGGESGYKTLEFRNLSFKHMPKDKILFIYMHHSVRRLPLVGSLRAQKVKLPKKIENKDKRNGYVKVMLPQKAMGICLIITLFKPSSLSFRFKVHKDSLLIFKQHAMIM
ncbi:hypothetical protein EI555_005166, partial [Monodon monoceros]